MNRKKKRKNPKIRLKCMQFLSLLMTFAPLLLTVAVNHKVYFATKAAGWSLTCGGMIAVALVACSMLGKGKRLLGSGVVISGIIFAMAYLLKPIILNLQLLSGMLFLGELINSIWFVPRIKHLERQVQAKENARAFKEELNE